MTNDTTNPSALQQGLGSPSVRGEQTNVSFPLIVNTSETIPVSDIL